MALRSPLTLQPYDYIGDSTGRPLDKGQIYIGVAGQDPEFYQVPVFLDAEMTKPIDQPIRTNDGFVDFAGSLSELYASAEIYSVKVLDKQGRKVLYKGDMTRKNLMSDALADLNQSIIDAQTAAQAAIDDTVNNASIVITNVSTDATAAIDNAVLISNDAASRADSAIQDLFENGGLPATPFATKALMTASALVNGDYAQVTDDTVNNGLYVKIEGVWVKSGYDPLTQVKAYTDIHPDVATGRAAVADGEQFQVVEGDEVVRYRRDSASTQTEVSRQYTSKGVDGVANPLRDENVRTMHRLDVARDDLGPSDGAISKLVQFRQKQNGAAVENVTDFVSTQGGFTVVDGYAVSDVRTSNSAPAFLVLPYGGENLRTELEVSANGQAVASRQIGPLIEYADENNATWLTYRSATGSIEIWEVVAGVYRTKAVIPTSLTGIPASWVLRVDHTGYGVVLLTVTLPDGSSESFEYTGGGDYERGYGIAAGLADLKVTWVSVTSGETKLGGRVSSLEKNNPVSGQIPVSFSYGQQTSQSTILKEEKTFDMAASRSELIMFDDFNAPDGTRVGTGAPEDHEPLFAREHLPTGYQVWGTPNIGIKDGGLSLMSPISQSQYHGTGFCAVTWPLSEHWIDTAKGVEISFSMTMGRDPKGNRGVFIRVPGGAYVMMFNKGVINFRHYTDLGVGTTLGSHPYTMAWPYENIKLVLRAYKDGGVIAELDGEPMAWGFFSNPFALQDVKMEGIGVIFDPRFEGELSMRYQDLKIGPIPAVGGSRWRSLPPEPAPVIPKFDKQGVVFDFDDADTGRGVLNFSVVPMHTYATALGATPIDDYYAYYSTDHDLSDGGVFLATAPTPEGPWTRHGAAGPAGRIFMDGVGRQTETPVVQYDPDENRLLMIYHIYVTAGINRQQSFVAESVDGINWTPIGPIYPFGGNVSSGLGQTHFRHTGYMSWGRDPLGVVPGWVGWSRMCPAADTSLTMTTRSMDGVHWVPDMVPTDFPFLLDVPDIGNKRVIHNHGYATQAFAYQGQRLLPVAPFMSAAVGNSQGYIAIVRLGDDMRNMSAQETIPFPLTEPEEVNKEVVISGMLIEGTMLYLYYQGSGKSIRLATADLSRDPNGDVRPFS